MYRICLEKGCNKTPSYNYKEKLSDIYCVTHRKDNMILTSKKFNWII
jgi:hypothetical protein